MKQNYCKYSLPILGAGTLELFVLGTEPGMEYRFELPQDLESTGQSLGSQGIQFTQR